MSVGLGLLLIALCVLLQGFFSGSELALVTIDRATIRESQEQGQTSGLLLASFRESPERILTTTLIGTNFCVVTSTSIFALLLRTHWDAAAHVELLTIAILGPTVLLLGELVPKTIYRHQARRIAPLVIRPLSALASLLTPLVAVVRGVTGVILKLAGAQARPHNAVTRDELRIMMDMGHEDEAFEAQEREMIHRVLDFPQVTVRETMRPLIDVRAVDQTMSLAEAVEAFVESGYSRLPAYHERVDDIVGVLHAFDVLHAEDLGQSVKALARPVSYAPSNQKADQLLTEMQARREGLVVVVDEYGGAMGVVTVEDILEEIVGEIEDESDVARPMLSRISEREWRAEGRSEREHLEEACGLQLPDGDFETVAGFMLSVLGRVPRAGETVEHGGFTLQVGKATDRAILEVILKRRS